MIHDALLFDKKENDSVQCNLCAHRCVILKGKHGICNVRTNEGGTLKTLVYGEVVASNIDPIEKKPLYHFLPGSLSYSVATVGCNFQCSFCQNWQISQVSKTGINYAGHTMSPEDIVLEARAAGCRSIAYTYTEPTIFFEYALDTCKKAKEVDLYNCFVTNGYMTREALDVIHPFLDACNVDLKAFTNEFYQTFCKAKLDPVLDSIRYMKELGIWVEVTTLLIPGKNDSDEELQKIAEFIASVDKHMPWHISRFRPEYKYLDSAPTSLASLRKAKQIGENAGLSFVYLGNVIEGTDTICPQCEEVLIERMGFEIKNHLIAKNKCEQCDTLLPGIY